MYVSFKRLYDICDTLAHSLAILFDISTRPKVEKILCYFRDHNVAEPYPVRVLEPPILRPDYTWKKEVDDALPKQLQSHAFCHHNGGIWPFAGGFYVACLAKAGKTGEARDELRKLAEANRLGRKEWGFSEWLHGRDGKPIPEVNADQCWNAGTYLIAYNAVKRGDN